MSRIDLAKLRRKVLDGYTMPQLAPSCFAPPHHAEVDTVMLSYQIDRGVYEALIPPGLEPCEEPLCQIWAHDFHRGTFGPYRELMVTIIVKFKGKKWVYGLYFLLDSFPPIIAGRDIWGTPKDLADGTRFEEKGKLVSRVFRQGGVDSVSVSLATEKWVDDPAELPIRIGDDLKLCFWKRIPSATAGAPPDIDRIVTVDWDVKFHWGVVGKGQIDYIRMADNPLYLFEPVTEPQGCRMFIEWTSRLAKDAVLLTYDEYVPDKRLAFPQKV